MTRRVGRVAAFVLSLACIAACTHSSEGAQPDSARSHPTTQVAVSPLRARPLPAPVRYATSSSALSKTTDPTFTALPNATAHHGHLGASTFQIEIPKQWNHRLVMWMHGFESFATTAAATPPDFRRYLITHGYAWAASSFSTTSFIPGLAADETAALWDYFVRTYGRPNWTYVGGLSMGGWSTAIAAERYGNRYDGALAECGAAGVAPGLGISIDAVVAGAYAAGVRQADVVPPLDADQLIATIEAALHDPAKRSEFDRLMVSLTGGPRAFATQGLRAEESTNFDRAKLLLTAGLVPPRTGPYQLAAGAPISAAAFNRAAITFASDADAFKRFTAGMEVTGKLAMPLLSLHTTGDGQVPISQAQILGQRVAASGRSDQLVERVFKNPDHCGFSTAEQEMSFAALVDWVEHHRRPAGTNLASADLEHLDRTFEQHLPEGIGAAQLTIRGHATLDGNPFDARWIGAVVASHGLITPCNVSLPPITNGAYEIGVYAARDSAGCGASGATVVLWTFVDAKLYATTALRWPATDHAQFDAAFSSVSPRGAVPAVTEFSGQIYDARGGHVAAGARVEAAIGTSVCGVASLRADGYYILSVVGPDTIAGCGTGATITFRVNDRPVRQTAVNRPTTRGEELDLTAR